MQALTGGGTAELVLNTPNAVPGDPGPERMAIPGLPADAVVEVPCRVSPDGVEPLPQERPGPAQLALLQRVKEVERLVVHATAPEAPAGTAARAAPGARREAALAAFARHPLVDSTELAAKLLAGYEAAFPELQELWRSGSIRTGCVGAALSGPATSGPVRREVRRNGP
jgi:6-phospho-beta-glucosidase